MARLDFIIKIAGKEYYMESPVENFMLLLKAVMTKQAGGTYCESATVKDTGNVSRANLGAFVTGGGSTYYGWLGSSAQAGAGNSNYGIQVGSDDTAVVITDYALNTKIAHGNGAGQLAYGACVTSYGGAGSNKWAKITRTFTNNTANPIDVKEAAWVVAPYGGAPYYIMITRDVVSPTYTVNAADTMPVEIFLQTTA